MPAVRAEKGAQQRVGQADCLQCFVGVAIGEIVQGLPAFGKVLGRIPALLAAAGEQELAGAVQDGSGMDHAMTQGGEIARHLPACWGLPAR